MSDKIVVTGVAGFIGSHQAEYLLEKGYHVVGIDNFHPYYSEDIKKDNLRLVEEKAENSEGNFEFINGSVLEEDDLSLLPRNPKWVFHFAAVAGTRSSLNMPAEHFRINAHGTNVLLEYFNDIDKFIFISSSSVYGEVSKEELPVDEEYSCSPETPYSLSKYNAEEMVRVYSQLCDFDYTILRLFSVFGPRQRPDGVFTKFISRVLNGEPVTVYGNGTQSRDFTYVEDAIRGIFLAASDGEGVYNIGGGNRTTVNEIVDHLDRLMDKQVERKHMERHPGDVSHTHADISKAHQELGYSPEVGVEEGTLQCIRWTKEKSDNVEHQALRRSAK